MILNSDIKNCLLFVLLFFFIKKSLWIFSTVYYIIGNLDFYSLFMQQPLLLWLSRGSSVPIRCAQCKIVAPTVSTNQMPSLKMKSKVSVSCLTETKDLHVCSKSKVIAKSPCSKIMISTQKAEIDTTYLDGRSQFPICLSLFS